MDTMTRTELILALDWIPSCMNGSPGTGGWSSRFPPDSPREDRPVRRRPRRRSPAAHARPAPRRGCAAREYRHDLVYPARTRATHKRLGRRARRHFTRLAPDQRRAPSLASSCGPGARAAAAAKKKSASATSCCASSKRLEPSPAYIRGRRFDALAWNRSADALSDFSSGRRLAQYDVASLPGSRHEEPARRPGLHEAASRRPISGGRSEVSRRPCIRGAHRGTARDLRGVPRALGPARRLRLGSMGSNGTSTRSWAS